MFILTGLAAILFAILNIRNYLNHRETKWFRFLSMTLTLITTGFIYQLDADYVLKNDFSALSDVVPSMSKILWVCLIASVLINGLTLFSKNKDLQQKSK